MAIGFVPPIVEIKTWSPQRFKQEAKEQYEALREDGWWARFLSNHDKPRQVSLYGNDNEYWLESAKMLDATCTRCPARLLCTKGKSWG